MTDRKPTIVLLAATLTLALGPARAAETFAYPPAGRTPEQQKQDQYECHQWAAEQSQFDPVQYAAQGGTTPSAATGQQAARGDTGPGAINGALRGAALAEAADKDSGDGAAAGLALNVMRQRRAQGAQRQQAAQQQQAAQAQHVQAKQSDYERAKSTCYKARGYTLSEG